MTELLQHEMTVTTVTTVRTAPTPADRLAPAGREPALDPAPAVLAAWERAGRRGQSTGSTVHAVPVTDRTRTAVCGAPVAMAVTVWSAERADVCPDCLALTSA